MFYHQHCSRWWPPLPSPRGNQCFVKQTTNEEDTESHLEYEQNLEGPAANVWEYIKKEMQKQDKDHGREKCPLDGSHSESPSKAMCLYIINHQSFKEIIEASSCTARTHSAFNAAKLAREIAQHCATENIHLARGEGVVAFVCIRRPSIISLTSNGE